MKISKDKYEDQVIILNYWISRHKKLSWWDRIVSRSVYRESLSEIRSKYSAATEFYTIFDCDDINLVSRYEDLIDEAGKILKIHKGGRREWRKSTRSR